MRNFTLRQNPRHKSCARTGSRPAIAASVWLGATLAAASIAPIAWAATPAGGSVVVIGAPGASHVSYDLKTGLADFFFGDKLIIKGFHAQFALDGDRSRIVRSNDYPLHLVEKDVRAHRVTIISRAAGKPTLRQHFFTEDRDNVKVQVEIGDPGGARLASNYLAPVAGEGGSGQVDIGESELRAFTAPHSNSHGEKNWDFLPVNQTTTYVGKTEIRPSYNFTAIFNNQSRRGLVLGALTHDTWRSAIRIRSTRTDRIDSEFIAYSGENTHFDKDAGVPHGLVSGPSVRSAKFMIGFYPDYRQGLIRYAEENLQERPRIARGPKVAEWTTPTILGWKADGIGVSDAQQKLVDYAYFADAMKFFDELQRAGFRNAKGKTLVTFEAAQELVLSNARNTLSRDQIMDLYGNHRMPFQANKANGYYANPTQMVGNFPDASPEKARESLEDFLHHGKITVKTGALAGVATPRKAYVVQRPGPRPNYAAPSAHPESFDPVLIVLEGGHKFKMGIDATHPAGQAIIREKAADEVNKYGLEWLRTDFLYTAQMEGQRYDPAITTGVQAYNHAMSFYVDQVLQRRQHMNMAIGPYFPYHHIDSKRISGDSSLNIAVSLNALGGTWWMGGRLYAHLDPASVNMADSDLANQNDNNRAQARVTTGVIAGYLVSDNFLSPNVKERMRRYFTNPEVNALINQNGGFMPVELEQAKEEAAYLVAQWIKQTDPRTYYLVYFNDSLREDKQVTVRMERLVGVSKARFAIDDLWSHQALSAQRGDASWALDLPAAGVRLLRLRRID